MSKRKLMTVAATAVSGVLALSACTPQATSPGTAGTDTPATASNQTAQVAWNQGFYSYNQNTSFGNATANANILYLTNDTFTYYDGDLNLVKNERFGTYEKVSDEPLTVKQTIADTATWSDGVPVTPADLILSYGAVSGLYNTVTDEDVQYNEDTGELETVNEGEQVYFDASSAALSLITEFPKVEGNTVTYTYSKPYVDWEYNLLFGAAGAGLPAHVIGKRALGIEDPTEAADAVVKAFQDKDNAALAKISNVWNSDYNYQDMPTGDDAELAIGTGPYTITDLKKDSYITVSKNPNYKGEHTPSIDTITVRIIDDPQASVQALQNGEVLVTQPQATADILTSMNGLSGVTVLNEVGGTYEHVDMAMNNGGPFDPATYGGDAEKAKLVRQAFMYTIPRQKIIDTIIKPLNPDAAIRNTFTVVPGAPGYDEMVAANGMESTFGEGGNTDKAKELLQQAGVSTPVSVRFMYGQGNTRREQEFQLIKEAAEAAGFSLQDASRTDWGAKLSDTSVYDAALFGWQSTSTGVTESDANYRTGGMNNFYGYSNSEVDALFDQLQGQLDTADQQKTLQQVEKLLVDDAFGITIFQFPQPTAVSNRLANVSSIPLSPTYFWNFWEWTLS